MKKILLTLIISATIGIVHAQNVNIPDAIFKAVLVGNSAINTNGDAEIQVSEAAAFGGTIFCASLGISDLTGIEAFTALTVLNCSSNLITSLDVSQNTALTSLNCAGDGYAQGQITSLDVSLNTALTEFYCFENQLDSLNISQNSALTTLWCYENDLDSLNVSQNPALTTLWCSNNQLTSLDLSQNTSLGDLDCAFNQLTYLDVANGNNTNMSNFYANNNPNLFCVDVDDVAWSTNNWTNISAQTYFSTNCNGSYGCTDPLACNYDPLATIDDSSCVYLDIIAVPTSVSCFGMFDGSISATATGGTFPLQYSLGGGLSQTSGTFSNLSAGSYYIDVTDVNGCTSNQMVIITEPVPLSILVDSTDETSALNDGSATAIVMGGTSPYMYAWNNGGITNPLNSLSPGLYTVTVTDANGCVILDSTSVNAYSATGVINIKDISKTLIKVIDMLGQETPYKRNTPLFYIYDDGTVEKKIILE
jgi:hypothetical protein